MELLSIVGTAAFTVSGYLIGVRKRFDLLGIIILALLTAIGGGIVRDVTLNHLPRIFLDSRPLWAIFGTLGVAWAVQLHRRSHVWLSRLFIVADSAGLVAFSLTGAQLALDSGLGLFGVVFIGFMTAVGGGLIRDMLVNDVPFILHKDFYGSVAILVAAGLFMLSRLDAVNSVSIYTLAALGLALRLLAHVRDFQLPKA